MTALGNLHAKFRRWFGEDYDLDAIDAVLAAAAVIKLDGDPLWLLLVGGPGNAKTETVSALRGTGAHIVSTIASEGALLSGTSKAERASDASGGLLKVIGRAGVLIIKDFTSILSMSRNNRPLILGALREIYDGYWRREIGADGGRQLEWSGRIALIGAVTTAWDSAHAVISEMGDRFVLLRLSSEENRLSGGRRAIENTGHEAQMRADLSSAVNAVLGEVNIACLDVGEYERERLLSAADFVTRARTAVIRDTRGNVIDAHAPEMPTRFARQLMQMVRGGVAIGMSLNGAMGLAIRCARDSVPPLRLAILVDLADHPQSLVVDVRKRLQKPHNTIDRELQALHMLGLVTLDEQNYGAGTRWLYSLKSGIDTAAVFPDLSPDPPTWGLGGTDISGNGGGMCPLASESRSVQAEPESREQQTHSPKDVRPSNFSYTSPDEQQIKADVHDLIGSTCPPRGRAVGATEGHDFETQSRKAWDEFLRALDLNGDITNCSDLTASTERPNNLRGADNCYGCKQFGVDGCGIHSQHMRKLRQP